MKMKSNVSASPPDKRSSEAEEEERVLYPSAVRLVKRLLELKVSAAILHLYNEGNVTT